VSVLAGIVSAVGSLFGVFTLPGWFEDLGPMLDEVTGWAAGLGRWVPVASAVNAVSLVGAAIGIALVIRVVRIILSLFTGGGGSAS